MARNTEEGRDVKAKFIADRLTYTGDQLRSHWTYENYEVQGDSIVAFIGPCDVSLDKLVDLADRKECKIIFSEEMLHFIVEHFDLDLEKTLLKQKLLITILMEKLNHRLKHNVVHRLGDDLFDEDKKLSVSIATLSPVSTNQRKITAQSLLDKSKRLRYNCISYTIYHTLYTT